MYSPKIREKLIRAMYQIRQETGKPMTKQANEAIEEYIQRMKSKISRDRGSKKRETEIDIGGIRK